ncbi:hypothetical protein VY88_10595 [Azospirillum thiophilum]|uniref:Uncharacterized protein n=1 Tax=Azospirillum thiophilum TaxID=528244 RepID=A0A0F2KLH2_9PROT|nr:DUF4258 domain-containing protein [Azospirillum thiophilum]ALG69916.1 hypothetical protein AL072_02115 [Azospirillum thiophilum]KJR61184.1 hypothetical protein VY88_33270 [Azospirillum thiophilum]KJR66398.1 hypothetical protein VY88_10595 [Azospirillum thiophilum]
MADPNVVPLRLTKPAAARIVKEIAADPDRIVPVPHAKKRMVQRKISITQARRVVQAGFIDGEPWIDEHGNWRVDMRGMSAGEQITVGIAIEWRTRLLIITVF